MTVYEHDDQGLRIIGYNHGIFFYDPTRTLRCELYLKPDGTLASNCAIAASVGSAPESTEYVRLDGNNWASWLPTGGTQSVVGSFNLQGAAFQYKITGRHALSMPGTRNLLAGDGAGAALTTGADNVYIGYMAGTALTIGSDNVLMGYQAGAALTDNDDNVIIGSYAGYTGAHESSVLIGYSAGATDAGDSIFNTVLIGPYTWGEGSSTDSVLIGASVLAGQNAGDGSDQDVIIGSCAAGGGNYDGYSNVYIGFDAGNGSTTGNSNVLAGWSCGRFLTEGIGNTVVGSESAQDLTTGNYNVIIGQLAGLGLTEGANNVFVGQSSGLVATTGNGNVFLGNAAGRYETGSNKLFIDNAARASEADARVKALIYGVFDAATANQYLTVNGHLIVRETATLANTGLHLLDTNASHDLIVAPGSDLTTDRTLTIVTGDADRTLTLANSGTAVMGTGTATRIAEWSDANTLQDSTLIKTGAGVLTLDAAGAYTLTVPATGTAALLGTANVFTAAQKVDVASTVALLIEQDGVHDNALVVDTTNGRVGVNTAAPAAALEVTGDVRVSGTEVTVVGKNRHEIYLSDGADPLFRRQTYFWNGAAWVADNSYGFGVNALQNNTGAYASGFGYAALQNNTGAYASGFGVNALQYNTGAYASGFGISALQNNTGAYASGFGFSALYDNTGESANGFGYAALQYNTGAYASGFGYAALQNNTGADANGFGASALHDNTGAYANGFGLFALQNNTGADANGFGYTALQYNTGANANGFGYAALQYNQANNAIAIGHNAWTSFLANAAGAKTFDYTAVNAMTDRITVTAHGFGAAGTYVNIQYTQGTAAITGLTSGAIYQVKIIDADTVGFYEADGPGGASRGTNITDAGVGTGHKLTPQYTYTGSIVIGHDTNPTKAYQVTLGSSDIVETVLRGAVLVNTTTTGGQLAVDQASSTGAMPVLLLDQGDLSEEFIRFIGQSAVDASQSLVDAADMTTPGALTGWLKIYIQDDAADGAIADGYYYVPFYAAPTA